MRNPWNWVIFGLITALTVFSVLVVWPGYPARYLPNWIDKPHGPILDVGRDAMRLGLDLQGGTYILTEADLSTLPPGTDVDQVMGATEDIIERRVNKSGLSETEVTREGRNRLAVQIPGVGPEEAAALMQPARLDFRRPELNAQGDVVCLAPDGSEFAVDGQQVTEGVNDAGQRELQCIGTGVTGTVKWIPATGEDSQGQIRQLTGSFLTPNGAEAEFLGGGYVVTLQLTPEGGLIFGQITAELVGSRLGIFLDGEMIAAPNVNQAITQDQAVIEGLERDEAVNLARNLNAGALPVRLTVIQVSIVEATLGEQTLVKAVQAGMIGVLAVMAFMILYYRVPGVLASMALFTYIVVTMMIFKLGPIIGPVTITLAGIAGFVLSIGMAVDANILVFERMKEELRAGRSLASAVEHGFDRAWSSIRDANVSTLITCAILWWFGDQFGATLVRGFALTLGIGVLISMFSAITVTRTLLRLTVGTPLSRRLSWFAPDVGTATADAQTAGAEKKKRFALDFVDRRWLYFGLSAIVLVPGIISMLVPPAFNAGIEFTSGATFTIDFEQDVSKEQLEKALADIGHDEARVQRTSDGNFIIRLDELEGAAGPPIGATPPSQRDELEAELEDQLGPFRVTNFNAVSEIVSQEIVTQATIALIFAAAAILVYITWSFRNIPKAYRYGIAAVIAALHDAVFVMGAISIMGKLFGMEVDTMVITGLLTIIGFSVHDTIVVFDRIREKVSQYPDVPFDEVVNASLTETVGRSINTSFTVLLTVGSMLLFGPNSINGLLITLFLGVIAGTYSSIFIAAQIVVAWEDGDFSRIWRRILPGRSETPAPEPTV